MLTHADIIEAKSSNPDRIILSINQISFLKIDADIRSAMSSWRELENDAHYDAIALCFT